MYGLEIIIPDLANCDIRADRANSVRRFGWEKTSHYNHNPFNNIERIGRSQKIPLKPASSVKEVVKAWNG